MELPKKKQKQKTDLFLSDVFELINDLPRNYRD